MFVVSFVALLNKKIISLEKKCSVQDNEIEHLKHKIQEVQDENRSCLNYERNNKSNKE